MTRAPARLRGQSLVIAALSLLLLMLIVMMTLGIGMRVREKIELQTATDAAAFSSSTLVARAYNEIALTNRAIVGDMVAMAATHSLISYTSTFSAHVQNARAALNDAKGQYQAQIDACTAAETPLTDPGCSCAVNALADGAWASADAALAAEVARIDALPLNALDQAAADQASAYRQHALGLHQHAVDFFEEELSLKVSPYQVAKTFAGKLNALAGELKTPVANDAISLREAHYAVSTTVLGGRHDEFVNVGRGTRYQFVLARGDAGPMNIRFAGLLAAAAVTNIAISVVSPGTADWEGGNTILAARDTGGVFATFSGAATPCGQASGGRTASAQVLTVPNGHQWARGAGDCCPTRHELKKCETEPGCVAPPTPLYDYSTLGRGTTPPQVQCTEPRCTRHELPAIATAARMAAAMSQAAVSCAPCPGVWPPYLHLSPGCDDPRNVFCQPKSYLIIQRDYGERTNVDPWNLSFRFRFTPAGQSIDLRRLELADGTNIARQTAVAAGLAYYHYQGGAKWREAPNLLNPFWRGTLSRMDIDAEGDIRATPRGDDIPNFFLQSINVASPASRAAGIMSRDVFLELTRNGYMGVQ